jgi:amidase
MATHMFQPTYYHRTIASHVPVLSIADGDTVITTTIDAFGKDAREEEASPGGNPMTGPFYVEGTEPGDALVFRIDRITPNREMGYTAYGLATNVVDPDYVTQLPQVNGHAGWRIDRERGTVTLAQTDTALRTFSLPLAPMIGCFGVAPARGQAISTATSAENGGNMDYRGFKAGATVYFPVFVPGALVHLGDVHAVQGHGEICGTGIEVSAEVQFTVRVIKDKRLGWPRGENDEYIFTAGNARPLDQALQHATTEMMRWLQQDYGLDGVAAGFLLGQAVEYEVGNVYDPAYTMICKVPKRLLEAYRK